MLVHPHTTWHQSVTKNYFCEHAAFHISCGFIVSINTMFLKISIRNVFFHWLKSLLNFAVKYSAGLAKQWLPSVTSAQGGHVFVLYLTYCCTSGFILLSNSPSRFIALHFLFPRVSCSMPVLPSFLIRVCLSAPPLIVSTSVQLVHTHTFTEDKMFLTEWKSLDFLVEHSGKPFCLICQAPLAYFKASRLKFFSATQLTTC